MVVVVEILPSARKHGIVDDDIRYGYTNAIASITAPDQPDFTMLVGADEEGQLLEIGVMAADDNDSRDAGETEIPATDQPRPRRRTMKTKKHPRELNEADIDDIVAKFDDHDDDQYTLVEAATLQELRAAVAARREADGRIEAAVTDAHRAGLSWGVIGAQLGMTRQGARQRFDQIIEHSPART